MKAIRCIAPRQVILYISCHGSCSPSKSSLSTYLTQYVTSCLDLGLRPSTNFPSPLLPLNPARHTDILIPDKLPDNPDPTLVPRQVSIELIRQLMQLE